MNKLPRSLALTGKIALIGIIIIVLLIPIASVIDLVSERQYLHRNAVSEITSMWGKKQNFMGPFLVVPYDRIDTVIFTDSKGKKNTEKNAIRLNAFILPEKLNITGNLAAQTRSRGIHDALLYTAQLGISGNFKLPIFPDLPAGSEIIPHWSEAKILISLSDARSISQQLSFSLADQKHDLESDDSPSVVPGQNIVANFDLTPHLKNSLGFRMDLNLAGSEEFQVTPIGKQTSLQLSSSWPHPKFSGYMLPSSRTITAQGFDAEWNIGAYGRGLRDAYFGEFPTENLKRLGLGVALVFPVDVYTSSTRATKYAALFLLLTFVIYFLFELLSGKRIHPVQYLLIGFAMCLFYLLLLSLAEHIVFYQAYICATLAITILVTLYSYSVLHQLKGALAVGAFQGGIYTYLYVLLQSEDYALLMGSTGLIIILGTVMFLTRRFDWYTPSTSQREVGL